MHAELQPARLGSDLDDQKEQQGNSKHGKQMKTPEPAQEVPCHPAELQ
jgi:hypothetical protein